MLVHTGYASRSSCMADGLAYDALGRAVRPGLAYSGTGNMLAADRRGLGTERMTAVPAGSPIKDYGADQGQKHVEW